VSVTGGRYADIADSADELISCTAVNMDVLALGVVCLTLLAVVVLADDVEALMRRKQG